MVDDGLSVCPKVEEGLSERTLPVCPKVDDGLPVCSKVDDGLPVCPKVDDGLPGCPKVDDGLPVCSKVDGVMPGCPKVDDGLLGCSKVDDGLPGCPKVDDGLPGCPEVDDGLSVCSKVDDGLPVCPKVDDGFNDFLQRSPHIGSWGPVLWYLVLCALFVWVLVYLIILRGSAGFIKVISALAPATAVCILIVLIYGYSAVPGSSGSLYTFLTHASDVMHRKKGFDSSQDGTMGHFLSRPAIWIDALDLHTYGLGLWAGTLPFLGTHLAFKKKVIKVTTIMLLALYSLVPHLLLVMLVPFIDPTYPGGTLQVEVGIKPGLSYLFVSIPHKFHKYGLSPFILFLIYATFILVNIQHLCFHVLMIWENVWPSIPKVAMAFFKRTPFLLAAFCFISFLLTAPYLSQVTYSNYNIQHLEHTT
ncbi:sodium- and chloride-dependent neutral and basic amino acid transporter B(0+)-like [Physella acuta]|uniref:sodium- and chloride-dependent neutral and basic amino acid transporter B(0+)-like n=1 Tax=Physella acuta TaxID=109671 RepID=UPI0027DBA954|nr:sodium- and chloride-dependent neutral and basic amino acid transporter B(0+)-like [Physella acuta]